MNGSSYTYGATPHAVTQIGSGSLWYAYDANGNMTNRCYQTITWDVENKPVSIAGATFVYDGDGNRVKKTEGGQTILYVNKYYEKNLTTSEVTTHYYLGDREIAYRNNNGLRYVLQDSLTSTSVTTDIAGATVGSIKYFPFGGTRSTSGTLDTDKKFTGQRLDQTGLYFYNARYYDATIGRFISPDTMVPNPANPQSLNRYSYCLNNPLRYNDPSGNITAAQAVYNAAAAAALFGPSFLANVAPAVAANTTMSAAVAAVQSAATVSGGAVTPVTAGLIGACLSGNISNAGYSIAMSVPEVSAAVGTYWDSSLEAAKQADSAPYSYDPFQAMVKYNNPGTDQNEILVNSPGFDMYEGYMGYKGFITGRQALGILDTVVGSLAVGLSPFVAVYTGNLWGAGAMALAGIRLIIIGQEQMHNRTPNPLPPINPYQPALSRPR